MEQKDLTLFYFEKAWVGYKKWGANTKVEHLEKHHPAIFKSIKKKNTPPKIAVTKSPISLDLNSAIKASQTISGEIVLEKLLKKMMHIIMESAAAPKGLLLLNQNEQLTIEASYFLTTPSSEHQKITVLQGISIKEQATQNAYFPSTVIYYVHRKKETVVLHNATQDKRFSRDTYIQQNNILSILCMPIMAQGKLNGILSLENNLTSNAFTPQRIQILQLLSAQIVISIENAMLYKNLAAKNEELLQLNKSLTQQNKDLNQFAYVTSHNIREPVATTLGLVRLFNKKDLSDPLNLDILENLERVTLQLDAIIRELNELLPK